MKYFSHFLGLTFLFISLGLQAAVVPLQDRVLFSSSDSDRRLLIVNNDSHAPVLLQSWVDDGSSGDMNKEKNYPFVVIPAVVKMSPGKIINLKILPTEKMRNLPRDRESVFWINLYEIPGVKKSQQKENTNKVEVGLNTQLKIIYRPFKGGLGIKNIAESLKISLADNGSSLEITNPTPYYVTLASVTIKSSSGEQSLKLDMNRMMAPFSYKRFAIPKATNSKQNAVEYNLLDDAGNEVGFSKVLN